LFVVLYFIERLHWGSCKTAFSDPAWGQICF